ncbi:hypothetical protein BDEG_21506 [Batrachochytrium dendrobatidis JEL423]|nr:hypothetical protein BDEG_21506 [Batrachochytrium dendrobatidis JEL423]
MDTPLEVIPMFLRGGSIVPRRDRVRRSSSLSKADPYTLIVALDKSGAATGTLYVDDGRSYAFQKGEYIFNTFVFKQGKLTSTSSRLQAVSMADLSDDGLESLGMRIERIILVGAATSPEKVVANGVQADFKVTSMGGVFMVVVKNPKIAVGHAWTVEFA